jgi:hypothetical protein
VLNHYFQTLDPKICPLEGAPPGIAVTHLKNCFSEPVVVPSLLVGSFLLVDELPELVEPFLSVFLFTANTGITRLPLDAVIRDIAVTTAKIANAAVIIFFYMLS